jgi:aminoglycoside phosphotransferase (APT) family kinase protein
MDIGEMAADTALVRRLLAAQFPRWADLPIEPVPSAGTDNALYRLGKQMVIRLPRVDWAMEMVEKEQRWLPALAPHLPLPVPVPLVQGAPAEGYPWHWSVYRWLGGENATVARIADPRGTALELAGFIAALQRIDPAGGPPPGPHNVRRGQPLALRDAEMQTWIARLAGVLDDGALTAAWEAALRAPAWEGPPVWIHGDLHPANLLVERGRLSAVIDFGCLGVGDPACDLMIAWAMLTADNRAVFRAALRVDDATWARGRGWALTWVGALVQHRTIHPVLSGIAWRAIAEVLADQRRA